MPLEITVSARHTEISPALRAAAEEKIGRLSRFLDGMHRAEVHFSEEHNPRIAAKEVCEVSLEGRGHHVRCKVAAADGFAAIDLAVEKLEHQLYKLKSKLVPRKARRSEPEPALGGDGLVA
jgi:putative sigma-54 modulation protein